METAALQPDIVGQCYRDCEGLIRATVQAFVAKHGGHFDDLFADASMAFMQGHRAYVEGRNNDPNYEVEIRRWVWFELFDAYRLRTRRRYKNPPVVENREFCDELLDKRGTFDLVEFFDELSEDARIVARLVLETPDDLCAAVRARGGTDRNFRYLIRERLGRMGWTPGTIAAAFEEIKVALG